MTPGDEAGALTDAEARKDSDIDAHDDPAPAEPDPGAEEAKNTPAKVKAKTKLFGRKKASGAAKAEAEADAEAAKEEAPAEDAPAVEEEAPVEDSAEAEDAAPAEADAPAAGDAEPAGDAAPAEADASAAGDAEPAEADASAARSDDEADVPAAKDAQAEDAPAAKDEDEDEDAGEEPAEASPTDSGDDEPSAEDDDSPRSAGVWAASVAVLVVLLIAGVVTAGMSWSQASGASADSGGQQAAISTAKTAVSDLFTIDYKNPQAFASRLKPLAAGQFLNVVNNSAGGVSKLLQQGRVETTGKAQMAGVEKYNGNTAQVAVLGYEIVKNSQTPQGSERPYRMVLSMVKSGSKWVVSNLEFVQ